MRLYLNVAASILCVWALALLLLPAPFLLGFDGPVLARALTVQGGLFHLVVAIGLLFAARDPVHNLAACVTAILLFGVKTFFDLYGLLNFPPAHALFCLADLWLSAGLFVLLLREIPGILKARRAAP